jgi:hypothetical protein
MTGPINPHRDGDRYAIRVEGHLDARWSAWFDGAVLRDDADGTTVIDCPPMDQAALHGLLRRIRDAALPLISVTRIDHD